MSYAVSKGFHPGSGVLKEVVQVRQLCTARCCVRALRHVPYLAVCRWCAWAGYPKQPVSGWKLTSRLAFCSTWSLIAAHVVAALAFFVMEMVPSQVDASPKAIVKRATGAEAGIDRLSWLKNLSSRLERSTRPPCIGPLGCKMEIPVDSPCRRPAKKIPEVVIDGVVPGGAPETWVVAYRLICSACYEGGAGFLVLVKVNAKGNIRFLDKIALKKGNSEEIPKPVTLVSDDFDEDGSNEFTCRYRYVREKEEKCTGMTDSSGYLLIARPGKQTLGVLFNERIDNTPKGKGRAYKTDYRFEDLSDDGYPDLVMVRRFLGAGSETVSVVQSVRCYDESARRWGEKPFQGHIPLDVKSIACDAPVPNKSFAVVAAIHSDEQLNAEIENLARSLRAAGFEGSCTYDTRELKGFRAARYVTIVSAHSSRNEADAVKIAVRRAGFSPFVKELFKDRP